MAEHSLQTLLDEIRRDEAIIRTGGGAQYLGLRDTVLQFASVC